MNVSMLTVVRPARATVFSIVQSAHCVRLWVLVSSELGQGMPSRYLASPYLTIVTAQLVFAFLARCVINPKIVL